jgi:hypothetical protein
MHQKQPPAKVAVAVSFEKTGTVAFVPSSDDSLPEHEITIPQKRAKLVNLISTHSLHRI